MPSRPDLNPVKTYQINESHETSHANKRRFDLGMGFVEWMKHSCVSIVAQRMKVAKQVDAHRMLDSNSQSLLPMLAVLIDRNMYCAFVAIVS